MNLNEPLIRNLIIAIAPIPLFYLIYLRYFSLKSKLSEHVQSFLSGAALAIFIVLIKPYLESGYYYLFDSNNLWIKGFVKAALIEKVGALFVLMLIQRRNPNFSIIEATLSAMTFGLGFSLVENLFYAEKFSSSGILIMRIIFSVPVHLTTCGILGYYLGFKKFSSTKLYKFWFLIKALVYSILLHGLFDSLLLNKGKSSYFVPLLLICMVLILEFLLAKSQNIISLKILKALAIRFEDWLSIYRQPRFERWIIQSMGMPDHHPVHFFLWRPGLIRFLLVIFFIIAALAGLSFRAEVLAFMGLTKKLTQGEQVILLGAFPASISFIIIMVGAINPRYFKETQMKMPIISDVEVQSDKEEDMDETYVTYDISTANCFLRTSEELGLGKTMQFKFEFSKFESPLISGEVVWENYIDKAEPIGALIKFNKMPLRYKLFFLRYSLYRYRKGFWFNLRLPGFETSRKLFMRPITTMQTERVYESGEKIFNEGDVGEEFYLLKKGRVLFYKSKGDKTDEIITMDTVIPGQIFGEMAIVKQDGRAATAVCLDDCVVAVANKDNMEALIKSNPDFALTLIKTLTERVQMSEKILVGNIRTLQNEKIEREHLFHMAILLTMVGLGVDDKKSMDEMGENRIDMSKLSEVLNHIDDEDVSTEILSLVMRKQHSDASLDNNEIATAINNLFEKFNKNPNEGV